MIHPINRTAWAQAPRNCPVLEYTADGRPVGTCTFFMPDGKNCPRHGDITESLKHALKPEKI